jgi:hypothetical protein
MHSFSVIYHPFKADLNIVAVIQAIKQGIHLSFGMIRHEVFQGDNPFPILATVCDHNVRPHHLSE